MVPLYALALFFVENFCAFQGCGEFSQITEVLMPPVVISRLNSEVNGSAWMFALKT